MFLITSVFLDVWIFDRCFYLLLLRIGRCFANRIFVGLNSRPAGMVKIILLSEGYLKRVRLSAARDGG